METTVREFKEHPSGWWCYVENGRWFPFAHSKETLEENSHRYPGDLWKQGYNAFVSDTDAETHSKMSDWIMEPEPEKAVEVVKALPAIRTYPNHYAKPGRLFRDE